jgi:hypothetical protein
MGGAVSQFIAYAHAQQTSKHPETFGKGNVEGVLAAGAVNNSREGGNLIPTVAFGIPGSVSMAILLSVFLIKGLVPGPAMLTRNLNVTYAMVWVIVLSNLIATGICFLFLGQLARLTHVKGTRLVPFLLVLTAFGAYTAHNSFADILLMLAATVVGLVAIRWDWPRAPLLLALVLGDIAERYLFLSYSLYEWNWIWRPLVLAFAAITLAGVGWAVWRREPVAAEQGRRSKADIVIAVLFLLAGIAVVNDARDWPFRTAVFPLATGILLLVLSLVKLVVAEPPAARDEDNVLLTASRRDWLAAAGWMVVFFILLWFTGALVAVPLFAAVYLLAASRESPVLAGAYALASWAFVYGLFDRLLRIPLP